LSSFSGHAGPGKAAFLAGSKVGRDSLLEIRSPEFARPVPPRTPETPEVVQAFISRHRSFFILLVVLVGQLVLLSVEITRDRNLPLAKRWAVSAMAPFERSLRGLVDATGGTWEALRDLSQAEEQKHELGARLAADEAYIRDLSEAAAENQRLRSLLDFKTQAPYATVAAEVIGSSPGEGSNTVLIDKGADAGLTADLAVVTPDGVAGKLVAVYPHTAQVLLITDPAAGAGGLIEKSRSQGVLKGVGRGRCRLDYVMNEDSVSMGDVVLTSGLDRIFPKGLPLGRVVKAADGNIYKDIEVTPAVALDRLEEVLVVTSKPAALEEAKTRN
jgi:rod shape-determining protein MreC